MFGKSEVSVALGARLIFTTVSLFTSGPFFVWIPFGNHEMDVPF